MSKRVIYEVEDIIGKRIKNSNSSPNADRVEYQIKWVGFDDEKDYTWEPESNLLSCQQMVDDFERALAKKTAIRS